MAEFNAVNRGVYIADNWDFLRSLNSECVDLVCIDPPFGKNETWQANKLRPKLDPDEQANELRLLKWWDISNAAEAAAAGLTWPDASSDGGRRNAQGGFTDIWSWQEDINEDWMLELESRENLRGIHRLIDATRYVHGDDIAAYLCYMAVRIIEIRRVLKPTGSLFLHCDHTANGYLRQLLDGVFGKENFRNEIVWCYDKWTNAASYYQRNHDTILFYTKTGDYTFNKEYHITRRKQVSIDRGYETNTVQGGKRQIMVYDWDKANAEIASKPEGHYDRVIDMNKRPMGSAIPDWWENIPYLNSQARERTGYPTQKPVALAQRIIQAVTNPGDVILDCFAGCAYVPVACEMLRNQGEDNARQWVACDMNLRTWTVLKRQFNKESLALLDCNDQTTGQQVLKGNPVVTVHGPNELPKRTSPVTDDWQTASKLGQVKPTPEYKRKSAVIIEDKVMLDRLLKLSDYRAWCCGFANRFPDGRIEPTSNNFHLDHIKPKSKGGNDRIYNRAPLCSRHNTSKGNRRITLEQLRVEIGVRREMLVDDPKDLIDLEWAEERTHEIWAIEYASHLAGTPQQD